MHLNDIQRQLLNYDQSKISVKESDMDKNKGSRQQGADKKPSMRRTELREKEKAELIHQLPIQSDSNKRNSQSKGTLSRVILNECKDQLEHLYQLKGPSQNSENLSHMDQLLENAKFKLKQEAYRGQSKQIQVRLEMYFQRLLKSQNHIIQDMSRIRQESRSLKQTEESIVSLFKGEKKELIMKLCFDHQEKFQKRYQITNQATIRQLQIRSAQSDKKAKQAQIRNVKHKKDIEILEKQAIKRKEQIKEVRNKFEEQAQETRKNHKREVEELKLRLMKQQEQTANIKEQLKEQKKSNKKEIEALKTKLVKYQVEYSGLENQFRKLKEEIDKEKKKRIQIKQTLSKFVNSIQGEDQEKKEKR